MNVLPALGLLAIVAVAGCGADGGADAAPPGPRGCPRELLAGGFVRVSKEAASLVSQRAKGAVTPSLAADGSSGQFVVYREDVPTGNGEVVLRMKRPGDVEFGAPQNLSNSARESGGPVVAVRNDLVAVAWLEGEASDAALVLRTSVDGGRSFGPALPVSSDVTIDARPRIAIDAAGQIVLAWKGASPRMTDFGSPGRAIWVARSNDAGRSMVEPVAVGATAAVAFPGLPGGAIDPCLVVGPGGRIFVAWTETVTDEGGSVVVLARSDANGAGFLPPISVGGETLGRSELAADSAGRLFLVSPAGSTATGSGQPEGVKLAVSNDDGASFTSLGLLDVGWASDVHLAVDDNGVIWASWRPSSQPCMGMQCATRLARATDAGMIFSPPVDVTRIVTAGVPLRLAALGGVGSQMMLGWEGASEWMSDVFVETVASDGQRSDWTPMTGHGAIAPGDVGAGATTPAIGASGERILVAWSQDADSIPSDHAGIFFAQSSDGGSTFSSPLRVGPNRPYIDYACRRDSVGFAPTNVPPSRVALAARGEREIVIAWADATPDLGLPRACYVQVHSDIFVSRSEDGGGTFSQPLSVSNSLGAATLPALKFDGEGRLLLLWETLTDTPIPNCSYTNHYAIFGARSDDGGRTFSDPFAVSHTKSPVYCGHASSPAISAAGPSFDVAWIATNDGTAQSEIIASRSTDGGRSFSEERTVFSSTFATRFEANTAVALSSRSGEEAAILWRRGADLFFSRWLWGMSGDERVVATAPAGVALDVFAAPLQMSWVTWVSRESTARPGDIFLSQIPDTGNSAVPQAISNNAGDSDAPSVALNARGEAVVAWQDDTPSPGTSSLLITCRAAP